MELDGKKAIITGASTGIGREIARTFGSAGVLTGLVARNKDGLNGTRDLVIQNGGEVSIFSGDLRNEEEINEIWSEVYEEWRSVDILVNAAGVWHDDDTVYYGPELHETPTDQIHDILDVGIKAPMLLSRHVIPGMIEAGEGKIINISGTFETGASGWLHYYVSKKAIEDFTVGLADEISKHGIQVNCVSPSDTKTEAFDRFFTDVDDDDVLDPSEIGKFAKFLVKDGDHITGEVVTLRNRDAY